MGIFGASGAKRKGVPTDPEDRLKPLETYKRMQWSRSEVNATLRLVRRKEGGK